MIKQIFKKIPFVKKWYTIFLDKKEKRIVLKKPHQEFVCFCKALKIKSGEVFLIGTPTHTNIGDSAIAVAEKAFLYNCGIKRADIIEITVNEFNKYRKFLIKAINRSKNLICLHGGGNMGDEYLGEELSRREIIQGFDKAKIIIFPQTIFYTNGEQGKSEAEKSIPIYNGKDKLTIVAREKVSQNIMQQLYPKTKILLTPDIVLSADTDLFHITTYERKGVLFVKRNDTERVMSNAMWQNIIGHIENSGIKYSITDMHSEIAITKDNREKVVSDKFKEFASYELIITDRLHGMIFAAITGTPCIVFSNYNHKVKGTYEWIKGLPYIKYVESVDEAIKFIPELLNLKNCKYDNTSLLPFFNSLKEIVKANAQN